MKLFNYEDYSLRISEEAYTLKQFKVIWNRDRSKSKDKALVELSYIYFLCDPRSDYMYIIDLESRSEKIIEHLGTSIVIDSAMENAIELYKELSTTTSSLLLEDTRDAIEKLRVLLRSIDYEERDDKGRPVYPLNTLTSTIKQIPELIKSLAEAERAVIKEQDSSIRMRGSSIKKVYENGF